MRPRDGMLKTVEPAVFFGSLGLILLFVALGSAFSQETGAMFGAIQAWIASNFGWYYTLAAAGFLIFVLWLMVSPYGAIRLGGDDSRPEFSYFGWFAMLFSAGMGIGLLFWSIAEPITHFMAPPHPAATGADAAAQAMRITFFHWGLHPWAIYIVVGLSMAYFNFRHGLPLTIRSIFYPVLGRRIYGPIGHAIDTFATVATLFGLATSLGLGVMQINTGLNYVAGVPVSTGIQVALVTGITTVAVMSVVSGLRAGVLFLSKVNMYLALALLLFVGLFGPTRYLLGVFTQATGDYLQHVVGMSFWLDAFGDGEWSRGWTIFYWAWWIAWAPFVGTFIARISRGRTIREFVVGVLLVPTLLTFLWLSVFGGTGLNLELVQGAGIAELVKADVTTALYATLEHLPLAGISKVLATLLIATFFVTSSDSGTYVVDTLISGGNPNPPVLQKVFWGFMEGGVAAFLLLAGGLQALQTASITAALPFSVVMLFMCYSLVTALKVDAAGGVVVAREDRMDLRRSGVALEDAAD